MAVGVGVSPLPGGRLDEALCLAVGLRRVGPGEDVADLGLGADPSKELGSVAGTVVGHEPLDLDAMGAKEGESAQQEAGGGLLAFVGQDLGVGEARGIIDADVEELPTDAAGPCHRQHCCFGRAFESMADALHDASGRSVCRRRWKTSSFLVVVRRHNSED